MAMLSVGVCNDNEHAVRVVFAGTSQRQQTQQATLRRRRYDNASGKEVASVDCRVPKQANSPA